MSKNIKELTIKVEGEKWQDALDKAYIEASKNAKIDGFRKGKAPKNVFMNKYGEESLYMDAADICLNDEYNNMLEENKDLEIVARPDIDLKNIGKDGAEFTVKLTLKPTITVKKYKGLKVKKDSLKATNEEIESTMKEMCQRFAENVIKDGAVANGDIVSINFEGYKDGVLFDGGKADDYSLTIGSNTFIPGFEEQLVGMVKEEEKEINVSFPEDYHSEDLKGKPVVFKVKINEIKEVKVPDYNEEFFADLAIDGVNDEATFRKQVEENINARKEGQVENKFVDELLEAAAKSVDVEIPDAMIADETQRMIGQYEENLKMQGLTLQQFYQFTNSNEEALRDQMKSEAEKRVLFRLMLEEIAVLEKIEITDEEAKVEASNLATRYQMEEEEFLKMFGGNEMIKYDLKMRKAIEVLKNNN